MVLQMIQVHLTLQFRLQSYLVEEEWNCMFQPQQLHTKLKM